MNNPYDACGENPLLEESGLPDAVPDFGRIALRHFRPAFDAALADARRELQAIVDNPAPPTMENTVIALERCGETMNDIVTVFFALHAADTSDEMEETARYIQGRAVEYENDISLDPVLFGRVKHVYDRRGGLSLDAEDAMLLEETYKHFVRGGAGLEGDDREEYRAITSELSELTLRFGQNVLNATNAYTLDIRPDEEQRLAGLPDFVRTSMAEEAAARGRDGWTVTLQAASYLPFLTYSPDRELKERLWRAYNTRCMTGGSDDNRAILLRIADLRLRLARLFGRDTYAAYVLEERMAGSVGRVESFIDELLRATRDRAAEQVAALQEYGRRGDLYGPGFSIMPWDWAYLSEKYKNELYAVSNEETKPYFRLEDVREGIFALAGRLYGIRFTAADGVPVYHPDVSAWRVTDGDGSLLGILYTDFFPRASKRGGAWMTDLRPMYTRADGSEVRPLVSMCCNFTKPTAQSPSLLTFDELKTFLHEFGHCLHGLFARGRYASLTGTNVYRDFVELPSQIMENWATEREFLDMFARHYLSGEKMPDDLIERLCRAGNYMEAYANVRQLGFAASDMAWHTIAAPVEEDAEAFERRATAAEQVLPVIAGTAMSPAFTHIFAGGYAAGYYGYKWAEVLDADAFSLFRENGIFDRRTAESFRRNILERGGSEHPMTLYVRFRGHQPSTAPLIDRILGEERCRHQ